MDLPSAIFEQTIRPDHVVLLPQDDGTTHMLFYTGEHGDGFIKLDYVIVDSRHVDGIARGATSRANPRREETLVEFNPQDPRLVQQAPILGPGAVPVRPVQPSVFTDQDVLTRF